MENSFWKKLKKPIVGLAPMDGVTDAAFRHMVAKYSHPRTERAEQSSYDGKPNVLFTEFVPTDGICALLRQACLPDRQGYGEAKPASAKGYGGQAGAEKVLDALVYSEIEKPIVAQIFGSKPENFYKVAPLLCEFGFDGVDINMGCPDKAIVKSGGGASLIGRPEDAKAIVSALKKGITDWSNGKNIEEFNLPPAFAKAMASKENILKKVENSRSNVKGQMSDVRRQMSDVMCQVSDVIPVSVKTRLGTNKNIINEWAEYLAEMQLDCVTIHGRTLSQMYHGEADWEAIAQGAEIIKKSGAIVLGNGDIKNIKEGKEKTKKYGTDGFLIGRAAMGAPWIFSGKELSLKEKLQIAIEHARYYEKINPDTFVNMRKHLAWYCRGFKDASEVRMKLMQTKNAQECENILSEIIEN